MQSTEGKKQFAAFSAVAASLERKTSVSSSYILENSEFETLVGGKYTNMLSIKRALLAAGVPNVSGYLIQDPYIPLHSQQSVAISVIGPIIDKQNSGKPYLANQFYISYRYSEKEVNIISIGGKVCSLPPQEFSMLGTEKPFLILGQPPNNSFKADAQSARP